jgi:ABC-2 type transport system permease protein
MTTLANIARSELCKLLSVRSTYWALGAAVAFNVALAALLAIFLPDQLSAAQKNDLDVVRVSLGGIHLSQVAFGITGALVITSEYTTGSIRSSLTAVPRRRLFLAAKAIVFVAIAVIVAITSCVAAYLVFQAALSDGGVPQPASSASVARALLGAGLFLTLLGLLGMGLGAITRSSAGAIAALMSLLFVPPLLLGLLPRSWNTAFGPYTPMEAGAAIFSLDSDSGLLAPWAGLGVFCLYVIVALTLGFAVIERRDA